MNFDCSPAPLLAFSFAGKKQTRLLVKLQKIIKCIKAHVVKQIIAWNQFVREQNGKLRIADYLEPLTEQLLCASSTEQRKLFRYFL